MKAKDATSEEIQGDTEEIINPTESIIYADDKEGKEQAVADVRAGITNALDNMVAFNGMTKEEAEAIQKDIWTQFQKDLTLLSLLAKWQICH